MSSRSRSDRLRRHWDRQAPSYDRSMSYADRRFFGDTREWVCSRASGSVLEVAIGTGLNLPLYPADVRLTGVEFSPAMLEVARRRAAGLGRDVDLRLGDAQALDLPADSYDCVVCTFALCAIPDHRTALTEMARVLRPGGRLLLADHVEASAWPIRAIQWAVELVTVPMADEHWRRRPLRDVRALGFEVEEVERFRLGIVERLTARKPS